MSHPRRHSTKEKITSARTQVEVTKLRAEGRTQVEVAGELGIHRNTVGKLEKRSMQELVKDDVELRRVMRAEHAERLTKLNALTEARKKDGKPFSLAELEFFHSLLKTEMQLFGTAAPARSISTSVTVTTGDLGQRFYAAIQGLNLETIEEELKRLAELPRPEIDPARCLPPVKEPQ